MYGTYTIRTRTTVAPERLMGIVLYYNIIYIYTYDIYIYSYSLDYKVLTSVTVLFSATQ